MRIRSRSRDRSRGGGKGADSDLLTLLSYGATDAWDFVNDQYIRGGLLSDGGISIIRNSVGTAETADGRIVTFGAGELRRTDKGILVEGARTNLFLNSLVGETQTITVTAVAHTLSFYGTGTITLSGVSTDGPLVGTGAGQRVTLTFTPTAGSLTLTVSGTVEYVQLEVGAFASSWIPTEGASVQRAADIVRTTTLSVSYPASIYAEYVANVITNATQTFFLLDSGGWQDEVYMWINNALTVRMLTETGNTLQSNLTQVATVAVDTPYRTAGRIQADNFVLARNGTLGTADTSGTLPNSSTRAVFGNRFGNADFSWGYIRRCAVFPSALTDAQLQGITA